MENTTSRSPNGFRASGPARKDLIARIKEGLSQSEEGALHWLLKTGYVTKNRREYRCGDVYGTAPKPGAGSFHYTFSNRIWKDYGRPDEPGGVGVFDVYVRNQDGDVDAAIELGASYLSIPLADRPKPREDKTVSSAKAKSTWIEVQPPADAPTPNFKRLFRGSFKQAWAYRDQAGNLLFYVARYNQAGGRKETPAITYGHDGDGVLEWRARGGKAILFGLELLAERPDVEVWVFEGEKTATAARLLFPDVICLAWKGGSSNISNIDMTPLAGRRVRFIADRDDDGAGQKAMKIGAKLALGTKP